MIAGRMRGHAKLCCRIIERKDCVCRPTCFERANLLKIFALKKQRRPARRIQPRARQHRRAMNVRTNPLMRRSDLGELQRHWSYVRDSKYESTTGKITSSGDEREEIA
jgi:hypothetical protein